MGTRSCDNQPGGGGGERADQRKSILCLAGEENMIASHHDQKKPHAKSVQLAALERAQEQHKHKIGQADELAGQPAQQHQQSIRPTRKRYFILLMFIILQLVKSFQWICLAGITNIVAQFYQVDNLAINWTTILFMVTFLVLALPVSWLMDAIGLRRSVLIGSIGVTVGVVIKCFSCSRDGFTLSMIGHVIIGLAEPFFFSSYSQVASIWFPDHQVAMATAASLIGEQLGLALGFIIPPLMIGNDPDDYDTIQEGLTRLFTIVAVICMLNTSMIILFFDAKPRFAPGVARQKQILDKRIRRQSLNHASLIATANPIGNIHPLASSPPSEPALIGRGRRLSRRMSQTLGEQMKLSSKFVTSKHFILLLIGFGMNQGIAYSIHTLLNQMITRPVLLASDGPMNIGGGGGGALVAVEEAARLVNSSTNIPTLLGEHQISGPDGGAGGLPKWHPEETNLIVGNAGLILIVSGLIGSGVCGFLLDHFHRYKLTTGIVYLATLGAMAAFTACLLLENELVLYLFSIPLGFALTGYASCAFDYGVEITYPKPELLSSTLLNVSAQLFGIPISLLGSVIVDVYGNQALGAFFCAILSLGSIITLVQGGRLRRQEAIRDGILLQND